MDSGEVTSSLMANVSSLIVIPGTNYKVQSVGHVRRTALGLGIRLLVFVSIAFLRL